MIIFQEATEFGIDLPMPSTITVEQKHVFAQLFLDYRKTLVDHIQKVRYFIISHIFIMDDW